MGKDNNEEEPIEVGYVSAKTSRVDYTEVKPTNEFRWFSDIRNAVLKLQQKWLITQAAINKWEEEWRDVPTVINED